MRGPDGLHHDRHTNDIFTPLDRVLSDVLLCPPSLPCGVLLVTYEAFLGYFRSPPWVLSSVHVCDFRLAMGFNITKIPSAGKMGPLGGRVQQKQ